MIYRIKFTTCKYNSLMQKMKKSSGSAEGIPARQTEYLVRKESGELDKHERALKNSHKIRGMYSSITSMSHGKLFFYHGRSLVIPFPQNCSDFADYLSCQKKYPPIVSVLEGKFPPTYIPENGIPSGIRTVLIID